VSLGRNKYGKCRLPGFGNIGGEIMSLSCTQRTLRALEQQGYISGGNYKNEKMD